MCIMFCTILTSVAWSQDLFVGAGGHVTIKPTAFVYAGGNVEVIAGGSLTAESDATSSSSFLAKDGIITGNITYKRHVNNTNWHLVSPPTGTQDIDTFVKDVANGINGPSANGNYAVAYYNNANDGGDQWVYHNLSPDAVNEEILTNFVNGQGYSMGRTSPGTYTFTGAMAFTNVDHTIGGGLLDWTCVGNPYPSFLPANDETSSVLQENEGILHDEHLALYLWDGLTVTYVAVNLATPGVQLAPGQAFMVKSKSDNETFTFNEELQSIQVGVSDNFQRTATTPSVLVNLSNGSDTSTTELKYFSNTTSGLDIGWDAGAFRVGTPPSLSIDTHLVSDSQGTDFMLQCLSDSNYEDIVPLSVRASAGEEITFDAVASSLPLDMNVYLEDKINNTIQKINDASYTVTLTDAVNGIGNFYLHTSRTALSIDDTNVLNTVNLYKTSNSNLRITGLQEEGKASVKMYSLTGQEVLEHSFTMQRVNDVTLPSLKTGVYLVQVVSEDGKYTKKLIIE